MRIFNRFTLQTPESVELEFTLAGIGNRAYALAIDYIILGFIIIIWLASWEFLVFSILRNPSYFGFREEAYNSKFGLWIIAIQLLILFSIYVGYFVFFETLWQGQTPGKRFVKIRVIRDDGRTVGLQQSTLRALLRPIDDLFFIGAFFIMLGKREKRLGDLVAGTLVIQEENQLRSANFTISQQAQSLANQLQFDADLSRLLPEDFALIRQYLQRREGMIPQARREFSQKLARQIKEIIALETVPPGVTSTLFLEAIYLAYQQQFGQRVL